MELSDITKKYFRDEDWQDINEAESIKDLFNIASRIMDRVPEPRVQVCGPISTGGKGSVDANLEVFSNKIKELQKDGFNVFDQMPFEWPMQGIKFNLPAGVYPESILNDFYLPIFESGLISEFYFMPNWKTSRGANWEHGEAQRLGIKINYL